MDAKRFYGDADGPGLVIDRAKDGTLLVGCRGWTCGTCEAIWATEEQAEACCVAPGTEGVAPSLPANGRWLRLYAPG